MKIRKTDKSIRVPKKVVGFSTKRQGSLWRQTAKQGRHFVFRNTWIQFDRHRSRAMSILMHSPAAIIALIGQFDVIFQKRVLWSKYPITALNLPCCASSSLDGTCQFKSKRASSVIELRLLSNSILRKWSWWLRYIKRFSYRNRKTHTQFQDPDHLHLHPQTKLKDNRSTGWQVYTTDVDQ